MFCVNDNRYLADTVNERDTCDANLSITQLHQKKCQRTVGWSSRDIKSTLSILERAFGVIDRLLRIVFPVNHRLYNSELGIHSH